MYGFEIVWEIEAGGVHPKLGIVRPFPEGFGSLTLLVSLSWGLS